MALATIRVLILTNINWGFSIYANSRLRSCKKFGIIFAIPINKSNYPKAKGPSIVPWANLHRLKMWLLHFLRLYYIFDEKDQIVPILSSSSVFGQTIIRLINHRYGSQRLGWVLQHRFEIKCFTIFWNRRFRWFRRS